MKLLLFTLISLIITKSWCHQLNKKIEASSEALASLMNHIEISTFQIIVFENGSGIDSHLNLLGKRILQKLKIEKQVEIATIPKTIDLFKFYSGISYVILSRNEFVYNQPVYEKKPIANVTRFINTYVESIFLMYAYDIDEIKMSYESMSSKNLRKFNLVHSSSEYHSVLQLYSFVRFSSKDTCDPIWTRTNTFDAARAEWKSKNGFFQSYNNFHNCAIVLWIANVDPEFELNQVLNRYDMTGIYGDILTFFF